MNTIMPNMNPLLIEDIFVSICDYTTSLVELLNFCYLSKMHCDIIRSNRWINIEVTAEDDSMMQSIIDNYSFENLFVGPGCNVNLFINKLSKCHTLDLCCTDITDESVKKLKNCHTLNLACANIIDECAKKLKNCHTLNLSYTCITDESAKKLKNCHILYLAGTEVTNECIEKLRSSGCIVHT